MKKALFLYSPMTGNGKFIKKLDLVKSRLRLIYDELDIRQTTSVEDLIYTSRTACGKYDYLIFAGGDGTFNNVVNAISDEPIRPILGYIPAGTINDCGRNFGINGNINEALNILEFGEQYSFDIGHVNDNYYFAYMSAFGSFSDISYVANAKRKKSFGKIAYYFIAIREAFKMKSFKVNILADGVSYSAKVPFVLLLNGKYVGGFLVNKKSLNNDGYFDLFLTKPGIFNGLIHYLLFKVRTTHIKAKHLVITPEKEYFWCLDGEKGPLGTIDITNIPLHLVIMSKRRK